MQNDHDGDTRVSLTLKLFLRMIKWATEHRIAYTLYEFSIKFKVIVKADMYTLIKK